MVRPFVSPFTVLNPLTPLQIQLVNDEEHRFIVNPSGRRSRKTKIGKARTLVRALRHAEHRYFCGAPTRPQAKAIFWEWLKYETRRLRSQAPNETELSVRLLNGTEVHVVGLDRAARIEGQPWNGCHITEFPNLKKGVWAENIRPVLSDTLGWAYLDGVPDVDGNPDWHELCLYACGGTIPETIPGIGAYAENPQDPAWAYYHWFSSDVLPPTEIRDAQREMDEDTFKQEYEGSFHRRGGLAYYPFGSENLRPTKDDKSRPLIFALDFNYDPMSSCVCQEYLEADGSITVEVLASYAFQDCDTDAACERVIEEFGENREYVIYPDPACQSRNAHGSGKSDLILIRQAFQRVAAARGSFQVKVRPAHPRRKDRMNSVNARIKSAAGERRLFLDPERCKTLIKDFNRVTRDEVLNDNYADPKIGHVSSAIGYYLEYRFPLKQGGIAAAP
jgi:hypothetical protein